MNPVLEDVLMHYGMPRRSGRYPWGSGENGYQHNRDFLSRVEEMKKSGFTYIDENGTTWTGEKAIYKSMGLTSGEYRREKTICKDQRLITNIARAKSLQEDGLGPTEIGRRMGKSESTVREWLKPDADAQYRETEKTIDFIREQVDKKKMVDVGTGVDRELGISKERLDLALYYLKEKEGYELHGGRVDQINNAGQKTTQRILCVPGTPHKAIFDNMADIQSLNDYVSHDGGETFDRRFVYPKSMDSKRLMVRYADDVGPDGAKGVEKDGLIEIRRGVEDLSLGEDHYAQVRILVDDKKYIKGMAVYSDNMPDGVDVVFNTNKTPDKGKLGTLKDIGDDPDNPFGSLIKEGGQSYYIDKDGNKQLRLINKTRGEGDWTEWQDSLPSQFLSKQSKDMAKKQLNIAKADKEAEYEELCSLTNPTVKKHLLAKFADECDAAAVHLKAAALPGQKYHVIVPLNTVKQDEVYAPGYKDGTKLALIRYPHGGTFEIPILKVNNSNPLAEKLIGKGSIDAICISKSNADRLSGADFDGDTVMCIPTHDKGGKVHVIATKELEDLKGFDPKLEYGPESYAGRTIKYMKDPVTGKDNTQNEMGKISNLITDMTLLGATEEELARAVRHSMVVIDAGKHKLDYKKSEIDHNIAALKKDYQPKYDEDGNLNGKYGGAYTIISKAKGQETVDRRQGTPKVNVEGKPWYDPSKPEGSYIYKTADDLYYPIRKSDKETKTTTVKTTSGKKITYRYDDPEAVEKYEPIKRVDPHTGEVSFTNKAGDISYKFDKRTQKSTKMAETDDAYTLVSRAQHPMEILYADYANSMKAMANRARLESIKPDKIVYSKSAADTYRAEVDSLEEKLRIAEMNAPRERAATRKANVTIAEKQELMPNMKKSDIRKIGQQALTRSRDEVGSVTRRERNIDITDREWEAIQAGAISETQLKRILKNTDTAKLRERATPRATTTLTPAKINRIKAMSASNTIAEIADALGVSTSTVSKALKS